MLTGKVAVITGAASGVGRATSLLFSRNNSKVVGVDLNHRGLEETAELIRAQNGEILPVTADITSKDDVEAFTAKALDIYGKIDILANIAGIALNTNFLEISGSEWDKVMAVNLKGSFFCAQAIAPHMMKQKSGKIINVASMAGKAGAVVAGIHYSVSKGAVITLTKCLAKKLAPYGINVNTVAPGPTETEMLMSFTPRERDAMKSHIPLKRFGKPDDQAHGILFLAGPHSDFITGATLDINGGIVMD